MGKFSRKEQWSLIEKGKKGCSVCGDILELDCFRKTGKVNKQGIVGYRSNCRYCKHVDQMSRKGHNPRNKDDFWHRHGLRDEGFIDKAGKARNYERDRVNFIRRVYNVDFKEALDLHKRSLHDTCEICGKGFEDNGKALAVDHCHSNGHVRGILCEVCNKGLGHFKDNVDVMKNAIKYLEEKRCLIL